MSNLIALKQLRTGELGEFVDSRNSAVINNYTGYLASSGFLVNYNFPISTGVSGEYFNFQTPFTGTPYLYPQIVAPSGAPYVYLTFPSEVSSTGFRANYSAILSGSGSTGYYLNVLAGTFKYINAVSGSQLIPPNLVYTTGDQEIRGIKTFVSGVQFLGDESLLIFNDNVGAEKAIFGYTKTVGGLDISAESIFLYTDVPNTGIRYNDSYLITKDQGDLLYIPSSSSSVGSWGIGVNYHFQSGIYYGALLTLPFSSYNTILVDVPGRILNSIAFSGTGLGGTYTADKSPCINWGRGWLYSYGWTTGASALSGASGISLDWFERKLSGNWTTNTIPTQTGHITNKQYVDAQVTGLSGYLSKYPSTISDVATNNYIFTSADIGKVISISGNSLMTGLVPSATLYSFQTGDSISILQYGTGQLTISGSGCSLNSRGNAKKLAGQFAMAEILYKSYNNWILYGDITV